MKLNLTVVIPCYGRPESTRRTLESLAGSPHEFEVVVVDDASPAPVGDVARDFEDRLDLRCVRQSRRQGPAAARNRGVRESSNDIIAFTDNDCVVHPDWPLELCVYLRDAPQRIVGVGGRVLALGEDVFSRYFTFHRILDPFLLDGEYLYLVTANCAFRRSALDHVGGFDERVRVPGGEDPGLCFKLREAGFKLHYRSEAVVWHDYRLGLRDFARTFYRYGMGCRDQTDRHVRSLAQSGQGAPAVAYGGLAAVE